MDKLVNFRDIGGIRTTDGSLIQKKRLLRSAEVVAIGKEDAESLYQMYDLRVIIDFRDEDEVLDSPDDTITGVKYLNIDIMKDLKETVASRNNLLRYYSVEKADERMRNIYSNIILNDMAKLGYRKFFDVLLAQKTGASLFHCFAGKDRTGLGAAFILTVLGVSKDEILKDYIKSNEQRKEANRIMIEDYARGQGVSGEQLGGFYRLMTVNEDYLEKAYEVAISQYGTFYNYIIEGIGITKEEIETLKNMYLE